MAHKPSGEVAGGLNGVRLTHMPNPINKALRALGRAIVELWDRMMKRKADNMGLKASGITSTGSFDYASAKYDPALDKYCDKDGNTMGKDDYTDNLVIKLAINSMPPYNAQAAQNAGQGFGMSGMQNAAMQNAAGAHAAMANQQQYPQAINQYVVATSTNNWGHIATMTALDITGIEIKGSEVVLSFRTGDEFGDPRSYHQKVAMPIQVFRQMVKMFTVESMVDKGEEDEG